jgi:hypothetical protein
MANVVNFFAQKLGSSGGASVNKPSKKQPFASGFHAFDPSAFAINTPKKCSSSVADSGKDSFLLSLSGNPSAGPRPGPKPGSTIESFRVGDRVLVRDSRHEAWEQGYIEEMDDKKGPYVMVDGYENPYYFNWIKLDPLKGQADSDSDDDSSSASDSDDDGSDPSGDSDATSEDGDLLGSGESSGGGGGRQSVYYSGRSSSGRGRKSSRRNDGDLGLSVEVWAAAIAKRDDAAAEAATAPSAKVAASLLAASQTEGARLFEELFAKWPEDAGAAASRRDRDALLAKTGSGAGAGADDETLAYSEVLYAPFVVSVLQRVKWHGGLRDAKVFTDLGCGGAKPVVAAALFHPFEVCRGVELLGETAKLGAAVVHEYTHRVQTQLHFRDPRRATRLEVVHANALFADPGAEEACDWAADSDLVFCNATSFSNAMVAQLELLCERLKPGSFVVTTTCRLRSPFTEVLEIGELHEGWGPSSVYLHRRLPFGAKDERYTLSPEEYVECMNREPPPPGEGEGER